MNRSFSEYAPHAVPLPDERKTSVVFIGAGNLATHLSSALQEAGFPIAQIYSRTEASASKLAGLLKTRYTDDIANIDIDASLYIIAVSDDAVAHVSEKLSTVDGLVVHTSGSVPMNVFSGNVRNYGVLYPLQTFSKSRPVDFSEIPIFLEADNSENLRKLRRISEEISNKVYEATSEERIQLHLAAVFACNFVNYLYDVSARIVEQTGFDFDVLSPLILETARKALALGNPHRVQTGPAVRNDLNVMQKHMELLSNRPELRNLYVQISECIVKQHR